MNRVVWRFDLDYVPWDTPDATEFGHGEPAMVLRLLEVARERGLKYHFFASSRVLKAFRSVSELVLNEGHALDWLCKHPERREEVEGLFKEIGHRLTGAALVRSVDEIHLSGLAFILHPNPQLPELREALHQGWPYRRWLDENRALLESEAPTPIISTRPQALAKVDPKLTQFTTLLATARTPISAAEV